MKINHFKKIGMYAIGLLVASALPMSLSSCSDSDDETSKVGALTIGTEQFDYEFSAEGDQIIEIPSPAPTTGLSKWPTPMSTGCSSPAWRVIPVRTLSSYV